MTRIKIEDTSVIEKFEALGALRNGLEEALMIYGGRKSEAWKLLKASYPHLDFSVAEYKDKTHELVILGGNDGTES